MPFMGHGGPDEELAMSFKKILVSTDRSELSNKAIHAAIELAQESGAKLVAVTVVEPDPYAGMAGRQSEASDSHQARQRVHAEECLHDLRQAAARAHIECDVLTKETDTPWEGIVEAAEEQDCDLIVMATRPRSGLAALWRRSQTQAVLANSKRPVLVYR
jgi:nucleotide-binding universal stress UspA family protein